MLGLLCNKTVVSTSSWCQRAGSPPWALLTGERKRFSGSFLPWLVVGTLALGKHCSAMNFGLKLWDTKAFARYHRRKSRVPQKFAIMLLKNEKFSFRIMCALKNKSSKTKVNALSDKTEARFLSPGPLVIPCPRSNALRWLIHPTPSFENPSWLYLLVQHSFWWCRGPNVINQFSKCLSLAVWPARWNFTLEAPCLKRGWGGMWWCGFLCMCAN